MVRSSSQVSKVTESPSSVEALLDRMGVTSSCARRLGRASGIIQGSHLFAEMRITSVLPGI